jgi:hypothetical protein
MLLIVEVGVWRDVEVMVVGDVVSVVFASKYQIYPKPYDFFNPPIPQPTHPPIPPNFLPF